MAWNASRHLIWTAAAVLILSTCSPNSTTGPSLAPTATPPATASPGSPVTPVSLEWTARVMPVGDASIDGRVGLVPSGTGDYDLIAVAFGGSLTNRPLTWVLARGTCAAGPAGDPLLRQTPWSKMVVRNDWATGPLALRGLDASDGSLRGCADLPVDAARARQPVPGSSPLVVPLKPAHTTGFVTGQVKVWPTPSGDLLLRAEVDGDGLDKNVDPSSVGWWYGRLEWFVGQGRCAQQKHVLYRQGGGPEQPRQAGLQSCPVAVLAH